MARTFMDVSIWIEGCFLKGSCLPNLLTALSLGSDLSPCFSSNHTAIRRKKVLPSPMYVHPCRNRSDVDNITIDRKTINAVTIRSRLT